MIRQAPGDVLEIEFEENYYYIIVITKIFMFGGNIVFAFHSDGQRIENFYPSMKMSGFNICTDLLLPKKNGQIIRLMKIDNPKKYLQSSLIKGCNEYRHGHKAKEWWLSCIDSPTEKKRISSLSKDQARAMDSGMFSFDLTAKKIITGYTPDKNPFIK